MSHPIEIPQRVHLLDSSGQVTDSLVPEGVLQQLLLEQERLREEIERLRQALAQAQSEREQHRRAFESLEEFCGPLLARELEVTAKNGPTLGEVVEELDGFHTEMARLREETAHLRRTKQEVEEERDLYLRSLSHLTRKEWSFTEAEILDLRQNGMSLAEAIEAVARKRSQA